MIKNTVPYSSLHFIIAFSNNFVLLNKYISSLSTQTCLFHEKEVASGIYEILIITISVNEITLLLEYFRVSSDERMEEFRNQAIATRDELLLSSGVFGLNIPGITSLTILSISIRLPKWFRRYWQVHILFTLYAFGRVQLNIFRIHGTPSFRFFFNYNCITLHKHIT